MGQICGLLDRRSMYKNAPTLKRYSSEL